MDLEVKFIQSGKANDDTQPKYSAKFAIEILTFKIRKEQFDNIVELEKEVEKFQKFQYSL